MNKRILAAVAIVIIIAAVFVAMWQLNVFSPAPSAEARNIKIGIVAGMQTVEGQDIWRAAQLAIDEINAAGGVRVDEWHTNVNFELVLVDTVDDAAGSTASPVTRAITEQGVDILIGGATTGGTLNGQIPAINNRVPFIITGASLNLVTRRGSLPSDNPLYIGDAEGMSYMFHYCTTISDYSTTVAHFLADSVKPTLDSTYSFDSARKLRLAILYRDDGYGRGVRDVTSSIIASDSLPIEVVANVSYGTTATTYQSQLISVKESKPDAVYVAGFTADTAEIIREGINDVGLKSLYIAVEICEDPQFYSLLRETGSFQILESKIATQWQGDTWYLEKVGKYVENYKAKFDGKIPGMLGADTYDAIYIAKNAIERAGTVNKEAVKNALETTDMPQSLLIMENERITFSTGTNYHEISPKTFIEQLIWIPDAGALKPYVVYPDSMPGISSFKQFDFALPTDYQPGSP
ncbi:MAG: ABC transporter substrate-binding protein [Candidatus Bathyarchaeota archaeon]|nr:ABC transporter substrate-binding protein [Candidatus Bathyarchaeota archaeon]